MKNRIIIAPGGSGILEYKLNNGDSGTFIPSYDNVKAIALWEKLCQTKVDGELLEGYMFKDGVNYLAAATSLCYWWFLYPFVQYSAFLAQYPPDEYEYIFTKPCRLKRYIESLISNKRPSLYRRISNFAGNLLKLIHNRRILHHYKKRKLVFVELHFNNFRLTGIRKALEKKNLSYVSAVETPRQEVLKNLFSFTPLPVFSMHNVPPVLRAISQKVEWPDLTDKTELAQIRRALQIVLSLAESFKAAAGWTALSLKPWKGKFLFGLDETNSYFPLFWGANDAGLKTVGFQHGLYCSTHVGYVLPGLKREFKWFDKVIVWGEYWKELILNATSCHPRDRFVIGTNKHKYRPGDLSSVGPAEGRKNVLVPYEFLQNTALTGKYIELMQRHGYTVYFKPRNDEPLDQQIDAHLLPEKSRAELKIFEEINDESMKRIDIVAGAQTTLVFDLLPYRKETWVLDSDFKMLTELVDSGLAKLVRLEHFAEDVSCRLPEPDWDFQLESYCSSRKLEEVIGIHLGSGLCREK